MSSDRNLKNLKKSAVDVRVAGICGGFGEYTPMPSWMWRVVFLVSLFIGGLGLITYIILWILMPSASTPFREERVINPEPKL